MRTQGNKTSDPFVFHTGSAPSNDSKKGKGKNPPKSQRSSQTPTREPSNGTSSMQAKAKPAKPPMAAPAKVTTTVAPPNRVLEQIQKLGERFQVSTSSNLAWDASTPGMVLQPVSKGDPSAMDKGKSTVAQHSSAHGSPKEKDIGVGNMEVEEQGPLVADENTRDFESQNTDAMS